MATRPTFRSTGFVMLDVYRASEGSYVDGEWQEGDTTVVVCKCNIQPLKPSETLAMPESERTRDWLKIYSDVELRKSQEGDDGWGADEFEWQGYRYRIMKVSSYHMGVLDHHKALAARIPITPNDKTIS